MSAKKHLTITIIVSLLTSSSLVFGQNEAAESSIINETTPQFLVRTEHNGKIKYVACALPNMYFHKATASFPNDTSDQKETEFTAKGGSDSASEYYGQAFFLVQDGVITACNESGDFNSQPEGLYALSRFSYPLSISPKSFEGKNINTVNNHPLFEKDPSIDNITIRLLAPKLQDSILSTEPVISIYKNSLGQIPTSYPVIN